MINKTTILPIFIFLFFLTAYSLTACGYLTSIDEIIMYNTAKNILTKGELSVSEELAGVVNTVQGKNGKFYGIYGIGVSIFIMPFILIGKLFYNIFRINWAQNPFLVFFTSGFNIVITATICLYLYKISRYYKYTHLISSILCFIYGLGTMAWIYTRGILSEPLQAMGFIIAFYYILKLKENGIISVIVSSIFLGVAIISKYSNMVFLPVYILFLFIINKKSLKCITSYLLIIAPFILSALLINYLKFGNVFVTGYELALPKPLFSTPLWAGLKLLLFSSNKSLFFFSPILIMSIFSIPLFVKKYPKSGLFILVFTMILLVLYSKCLDPGGGVCWGSRFLLPIIPFLIIPIGLMLNKRRIFLYILVFILFFASFSIQLLGILVSFNQYQMLEQEIEEKTQGKMPPHIVGHFLMLKHKLSNNDEIYNSEEFGIKQKLTVDQSQILTYRGIDLWYLHLREIKGIDIVRSIFIMFFSMSFILFISILFYSRKLDKTVISS